MLAGAGGGWMERIDSRGRAGFGERVCLEMFYVYLDGGSDSTTVRLSKLIELYTKKGK